MIIRHIVCLAIALECVQREFETRCGHVLVRGRISRVVLQQHQPYYRVDGCRDAQHILRIVVEMSPRRLCIAMCCSVLQCVAVCCSVAVCSTCRRELSLETFCSRLLSVALTQCNTLHNATHCKILQRVLQRTSIATDDSFQTSRHATLQRTATHCNTLQHTAMHTATHCNRYRRLPLVATTHYYTLQHKATHPAIHYDCYRQLIPLAMQHCKALQRTVQRTATHTATHCNCYRRLLPVAMYISFARKPRRAPARVNTYILYIYEIMNIN